MLAAQYDIQCTSLPKEEYTTQLNTLNISFDTYTTMNKRNIVHERALSSAA